MFNDGRTPVAPAIGSEAGNLLIEAFLSGRRRSTWEAYRNDLKAFSIFLGASTLADGMGGFIQLLPGEANRRALYYRAHLIDSGLQPSTINRRLAAIRSLVKLARMLGMVTWSIEVPNLKVRAYRNTQGPGQATVIEMLGQVEVRSSPKATRDFALLRLLYDLALRASEVTSLDLEDVDLKSSTVAVLGKGQSQKEHLALSTSTRGALLEWIKIRGTEPGPLFVNFDRAHKGKRLTRAGLYQIVRRLGNAVGVETRPHGIRHTAITQAIRVAQLNGITLPEVKQFSRHASLQTLQIYADNERNVQGQLTSLLAEALPRKSSDPTTK